MATIPEKYDMTKREDLERWFREFEGYIRGGNFVDGGTDRDGRKYALAGYYQLKKILLGQPPPSKAPPIRKDEDIDDKIAQIRARR